MSEIRPLVGSEHTIEIALDGGATGGELARMTLRMPRRGPPRPGPAGLEGIVRVVCARAPGAPLPDPADVGAALGRHGLDFSGT